MTEIAVGQAKIVNGRRTGIRSLHIDMIGHLQKYLEDDEPLAAQCVQGWLDPDQFKLALPTEEELRAVLARLKDRESDLQDMMQFQGSRPRRQKRLKEAAYCEAAIFCVKAWLP